MYRLGCTGDLLLSINLSRPGQVGSWDWERANMTVPRPSMRKLLTTRTLVLPSHTISLLQVLPLPPPGTTPLLRSLPPSSRYYPPPPGTTPLLQVLPHSSRYYPTPPDTSPLLQVLPTSSRHYLPALGITPPSFYPWMQDNSAIEQTS